MANSDDANLLQVSQNNEAIAKEDTRRSRVRSGSPKDLDSEVLWNAVRHRKQSRIVFSLFPLPDVVLFTLHLFVFVGDEVPRSP